MTCWPKISMQPLSHTRSVAVLAAIVAWTACGGKAPPTLYYALDLPAPAPAAERLDGTAVLMPLRAGKLVGQGRIVYRESREQVGFYEYHRWAEDPEDSIGRLLALELAARGTFASVVPFDGRTEADFILRGELLQLEEIDYEGRVQAAAGLALELVDAATGRVVWSGSAAAAEPVPASEVRSVVSCLGKAAERSVNQLVGEIDRHLRAGGEGG